MTDLLILLKFGFVFFIAIGFGLSWPGRLGYFLFGKPENFDLAGCGPAWCGPAEFLLKNILRAALIAAFFWFVSSLSGCRPKPKPVQHPAPPTVQFDTARQSLQRQLDERKTKLNTTQGNARNTVTDYEAALSQYNSTTVTLP